MQFMLHILKELLGFINKKYITFIKLYYYMFIIWIFWTFEPIKKG